MTRVPRQSSVAVNGVEIALWEWPGAGRPVLFCHAAGFHGRIWDHVIARLPDDLHCYAYDARGHGRSSKPLPPYAWRDFGVDAAAIAQSLGLSAALGVGHSVGGYAVTLAAALRPRAFGGLLLIDPVILQRDQYTGPRNKAGFVAKRRSRWPSPENMFESFVGRSPFDAWDRDALRDYCQYALIPDGQDYILACPPAVEAAIYEASPEVRANIYPEIAMIDIPVHVVRAGRYRDPANVMGTSPTAPDLAAHFAKGRDTCLPEHSHFIPMEAPDLTAKLIIEALALL